MREGSNCAKCRHYCKLGVAYMFSHIGLCGLVVGYAIMGAITFEALEANNEKLKKGAMQKLRQEVIANLWKITWEFNVLYQENWTLCADQLIRDFEDKVIVNVRDQGYDGKDMEELQWSFSGALLYSITVITTIGYGHIAPRTTPGKVITIVYAVLGIPLMLLCLANIGDALAHAFKFFYWKICCFFCHRRRRKRMIRVRAIKQDEKDIDDDEQESTQIHIDIIEETGRNIECMDIPKSHGIMNIDNIEYMDDSDDNSAEKVIVLEPKIVNGATTKNIVQKETSVNLAEIEKEPLDKRVTVPVYLCLLVVWGYIFGGAMLFAFWEGWSLFDGAYFCFVTLTTIGFGDLVPGASTRSKDSEKKLTLTSLYLLFGMALLAMSFNLVQEEVIEKFKWLGRKIGILNSDDENS